VRKVLSFIDRISTFTGKAVSILTLFAAAAIVYEIVVRNWFHRPTVWAAESTVFACGLLYLLGGAWTLLEDRHVRIDLVYARLSSRGRAILDSFTYFFFLLYVGVMLKATLHYAMESVALRETTMSPWDPPIYPIKVAMAAALALLLLQGTAKFVRDLSRAVKGDNS